MFDELSKMVEQKLGAADPQAVTSAASASVNTMAPQEVAQHAQTAASTLSNQGKPDLASELSDVVTAAQSDPTALRGAVVGFIEKHPETITAFASEFKQNVAQRI
jgi:ABC-type proline/glycine betaine transport system substrate-binding protein